MRKATFAILMMLVWTSGYTESRPTQSGQNLFEILSRLEQLQVEVQQLRGTVEEQTYKINELEKRQEAIYLDFDRRLQQPSKLDQPLEPLADVQVDTGPSMPEAVEQSIQTPTASPVAESAPTPELSATRTTYKRSILDEKQAYQHAYETLRIGSALASIDLFKQFLLDYPRGEYADNASYWLAEAYKFNQQTGLARATFRNLIAQFPNSAKVPDAKLKLGYIEVELNNVAQARKILTDLSMRYSGTSIGHLASQKLSEINQY